MAAGRYDTVIEQGATFTRTATWKDSAGVGINLTGYTVSGKLKRKVSDKVELASFTVTIANQGTFPGKFTFALSATQTALLPNSPSQSGDKQPLNLYYDIEASLSGVVTRLIEGILSLTPEVTK